MNLLSPTLPGIVSVQVPGCASLLQCLQHSRRDMVTHTAVLCPSHSHHRPQQPSQEQQSQTASSESCRDGHRVLHTLRGPRHPEGPHRVAHGVTVPCPAQGLCHSLSCQLLGKGEEGKILSRLVLNSASALQEQPVVRTCLSPLKCTQTLCRVGPPHHPQWLLGALLGWGRTCWSWGKLWGYQPRHQQRDISL